MPNTNNSPSQNWSPILQEIKSVLAEIDLEQLAFIYKLPSGRMAEEGDLYDYIKRQFPGNLVDSDDNELSLMQKIINLAPQKKELRLQEIYNTLLEERERQLRDELTEAIVSRINGFGIGSKEHRVLFKEELSRWAPHKVLVQMEALSSGSFSIAVSFVSFEHRCVVRIVLGRFGVEHIIIPIRHIAKCERLRGDNEMHVKLFTGSGEKPLLELFSGGGQKIDNLEAISKQIESMLLGAK